MVQPATKSERVEWKLSFPDDIKSYSGVLHGLRFASSLDRTPGLLNPGWFISVSGRTLAPPTEDPGWTLPGKPTGPCVLFSSNTRRWLVLERHSWGQQYVAGSGESCHIHKRCIHMSNHKKCPDRPDDEADGSAR